LLIREFELRTAAHSVMLEKTKESELAKYDFICCFQRMASLLEHNWRKSFHCAVTAVTSNSSAGFLTPSRCLSTVFICGGEVGWAMLPRYWMLVLQLLSSCIWPRTMTSILY